MVWLSVGTQVRLFGCLWVPRSNDLVVCRYSGQIAWLSVGTEAKWFGCLLVSRPNGLVVCGSGQIVGYLAVYRDPVHIMR